MRDRLRWILLMAMASTACCCAETIGYRFVAEPNTRTPVLQCPVLAQAPTATPFAAAGDELRDLTALARAEKIPLENGWALWNQTRKLLVVRGPLVDHWHAQAVTGLVPGVTLLTDALKLPDGRTLRQGQRASLIQMRTE
jgi:hypothetical protein